VEADELMSPDQLAEALGISVRTLYNWRSLRKGPPGFRVGRAVRYRRSDVKTWLDAQAQEGHRS
jgi:excisionase family DNA binding protein